MKPPSNDTMKVTIKIEESFRQHFRAAYRNKTGNIRRLSLLILCDLEISNPPNRLNDSVIIKYLSASLFILFIQINRNRSLAFEGQYCGCFSMKSPIFDKFVLLEIPIRLIIIHCDCEDDICFTHFIYILIRTNAISFEAFKVKPRILSAGGIQIA